MEISRPRCSECTTMILIALAPSELLPLIRVALLALKVVDTGCSIGPSSCNTSNLHLCLDYNTRSAFPHFFWPGDQPSMYHYFCHSLSFSILNFLNRKGHKTEASKISHVTAKSNLNMIHEMAAMNREQVHSSCKTLHVRD